MTSLLPGFLEAKEAGLRSEKVRPSGEAIKMEFPRENIHLNRNSLNPSWQKIPESPWGSPIPIGDGDEDVNQFPDGDGDGDGDEAKKRGWGW
ncbi:hypothetical protein Tco_1520091 [Tanacetum coccineum]